MSDQTGNPSPIPWQRKLLWSVLIAALLAIAVAAMWSGKWEGAGTGAPPVLAEVPAFSLTNRDGRTVTLSALRGTPWIADFIFTRCGGECPRMTAVMKRVGGLIPHPELVGRVSITVDPSYDTPAVLAKYAEDQGIRDDGWLFLTGEEASVLRLARAGFKLGVEPAPPAGSPHAAEGDTILHSTRLVLVDGGGRIRGYYDAFDEEAIGRLLKDLRALLRQG